MTELQIAYIAGMFDGEGTVGFYKCKGGHSAKVSITNADPRVMRWMIDTVGYGFLRTRVDRVRQNATVWSFELCRRTLIYQFLMTIRPYLIVKADQVDLLLSLLDAEQKITRRPNQKLSVEMREIRNQTAEEIMRLKTASYQRIQ